MPIPRHVIFAALLCWLIGAPAAAITAVTAPAGAAAPSAAASLFSAIACACFDGAELKIDKRTSIAPADCPCPYAAAVRKDLAAAAMRVPAEKRTDKISLALAVEKHFLTRSPEYERMLRYDPKRYAWFLQNVRCTCEGCKATVYFSNCQLSCGPAVVYKRRARIWLAMGFSTKELIAYYLAEHNATHSAREQIDMVWLLPKRQKRRGWMVPAILICGAIFGLGLLLSRTVRRSRAAAASDAAADAGLLASAAADSAAEVGVEVGAEVAAETGAGVESGAASNLSSGDRNRVLDALDDLEQDGGW